MQFSGIPHRPKPPARTVAPLGMSRTASAALFTTLSIPCPGLLLLGARSYPRVEEAPRHAAHGQERRQRDSDVTHLLVHFWYASYCVASRGSGPHAAEHSAATRLHALEQPPRGNILLLLDINMPRVDGIEVLRRLKADARTNAIPVVILTTTDDPREIERCYQLGCSVYVTKPVEYSAFIEAINRLGLFLQVVRVPSTGPAA